MLLDTCVDGISMVDEYALRVRAEFEVILETNLELICLALTLYTLSLSMVGNTI